MHLSRVVVRNFRNLRSVDVSISPGVTCITGENNVGKSNFLHAVRLAADANLPNYFRQLSFEDVHGPPAGGGPHHVVVSLEFAGLDGDDLADGFTAEWLTPASTARLTYRFRPRPGARQAIEDGERRGEDLTPEDYHWQLAGGGDFDPLTLEWNEPAGTGSDVFSMLQLYRVHFLPALRDVEEDLRYFRRSPLVRLIRRTEIADEQKASIVEIVDRANSEVSESEPLRRIAEAITQRQATTAGEAFRQAVRLGFGEATFDSVTRSLVPLVTGPSGGEHAVERNGLGLNNVLYIAMLLESFVAERHSKSAAGYLVLCEEPEAHLHPELQMALMRALRADGTQTLVTSHSTHVAAGAGVSGCICLTRADDGSSSATSPARSAALDEAEIADLDRYLDATRSRMLFARAVLLVEGVAEMLVVPVLARKVLDIDLDAQGVCVVPVFGTHFDVFAKLCDPRALAKRCAILSDGDLAPVPGVDEGEPLAAAESPRSYLDGEEARSFTCRTTFERTLVRGGCLRLLQLSAAEITRGPGARRARELVQQLDAALALNVQKDPGWRELLPGIADLTLEVADAVGKGRFAQVVARHAATHAKSIPPYIERAVRWVTRHAAD